MVKSLIFTNILMFETNIKISHFNYQSKFSNKYSKLILKSKINFKINNFLTNIVFFYEEGILLGSYS